MGRTYYVEVEGCRSHTGTSSSGVPQGSVLGPLLFLVYINDLVTSLRCPYYMFADDVKVVGNPTSEMIQEDLDTIHKWTVEWDMPLNLRKCVRLIASHIEAPLRHMGTEEDRVALTNVEVAKDLGIQVTADFKPGKQCAAAANKARWALHQLRRTVASRIPEVLLPLYKAYVRPHLEYAVQAWNPIMQRDIKLLQRIQRSFTRMIPSIRSLPYEDRLRQLNLFSLVRRRQRGDLIEVFKILKGFSDIDGVRLFQPPASANLRGHALKLAKPRARTRTRASFFSHRVIDGWNRLPAEVVESLTVKEFKRKLDECWDRIFPDMV